MAEREITVRTEGSTKDLDTLVHEDVAGKFQMYETSDDEDDYGPQPGDDKLTRVFFADRAVLNKKRTKKLKTPQIDNFCEITMVYTTDTGEVRTTCTRVTEDNEDYWSLRFPKQWKEYKSRDGSAPESPSLAVLSLSEFEKVTLESLRISTVHALAQLSEKAQKKVSLANISKLVQRAQKYVEILDKTQ